MLKWVTCNHANWIECTICHTVNIIFLTKVIAIRNQRIYPFWYFPNKRNPAANAVLKYKDLAFIWTQEGSDEVGEFVLFSDYNNTLV